MNDLPRLMIIGIDGINHDLIDRLIPKETLPNLHRLMERGASGKLRSVFPTHSAAAWATFMTGQTPAAHGVFDFKNRLPDGHYTYAKPDFRNTIWYYLNKAGLTVGVFNFPVTFPPDPIDGWMISGMLSPDLKRFAYPSSLADELIKAFPNYILDVEWTLFENRPKELLNRLIQMVTTRGKAARYLLENHPVDVFALAYIATDRAQHALWRFMDPEHPQYNASKADELHPYILNFYQVVDNAIGDLLSYTGDNTNIVILSDHGFQAAAWQFHVNDWLREQGWLTYFPERQRFSSFLRRFDLPRLRKLRQKFFPDVSRYLPGFAPGGNIDWQHTVAFCPWNFHQGVRINLEGRDPQGIVPPGNGYITLRDEIITELSNVRHKETDCQVSSEIYLVDGLYTGPYLSTMPDIVFELNRNYAPGIHREHLFEPTGWVSGDHNLDGIIAIYGPGIEAGQSISAGLIDVAPTICTLLKLAYPDSMQGKPFTIFSPSEPDTLQNCKVPEPEPGVRLEINNLTPEEERLLLEQLRNLGYM